MTRPESSTGRAVNERSFAGYDDVRRLDLDPCFETLRARDTRLPRTVWIRALARGLAPESVFGAALRQEAKALLALDHAGIPRCYQLVEEQRSLWLVLETAEGHSLKSVQAEHTSVPPLALCTLMRQLAESLSHCHERDIVHGSVRPSCVWVTADGARLTDFTRASIGGDAVHSETELPTDRDFAAPEQRVGGDATPASDLFSLGRVIQASMPMQAPREFVSIVSRCTERQPADRYPNADALIFALQEWQRSVDPDGTQTRRELSEFNIDPKAGKLPELNAQPGLSGRAGWFAAAGLAAVVVAASSAFIFGGSSDRLELAPEPQGYLRVLAQPWAHVWINGQRVETTPFAHPIELLPGEYDVRLQHPEAEKTLAVTIERGETEWLNVELLPSPTVEAEDVPKSPSP